VNPWPYPRWIAHCGAGLLAPENTLAALRLGAERGFTMFEFDVKLSADRVPVLMHDATLWRTAGMACEVASRSWAALADCDVGRWHSPRYAGEPIPTLARVGAWLQANRHCANIEIKPCPGREAETAACIVEQLDAHWRDAVAAPLLSSFSEAALAVVQSITPHWPRALLFDRDLPQDWLRRCQALGCVAVVLHQGSVDPDRVERAHAAGLHVVTYTVNDPRCALEFVSIGVDAVITDAVECIPAR
jgi:glycerophosphoryl diester phosphodiesterase